MLHTTELPVGPIDFANCFPEGLASSSKAVFLGLCDVWVLVWYQYLSLSTRESVFTVQVGGGLKSWPPLSTNSE